MFAGREPMGPQILWIGIVEILLRICQFKKIKIYTKKSREVLILVHFLGIHLRSLISGGLTFSTDFEYRNCVTLRSGGNFVVMK